jgi:two-component system, NarL family, invasion response regulator UvrY
MIKVLIVDDHPLVREGVSAVLAEASDMKVINEARDGNEALEKARLDKPHIVLLDISLPGKNGLEVLKQLHVEMPEVRVLILSIYPEKQYAVRCLKNGASGYLTKKSLSEELLTAIRTIAQGGKYVSESVADLLVSEIDHKGDKMLHERLSDREFEILCLIGQGKKVTEIAAILSIGKPTVSTHRAHILEKMNMQSTAELIQYVLEAHLADEVD